MCYRRASQRLIRLQLIGILAPITVRIGPLRVGTKQYVSSGTSPSSQSIDPSQITPWTTATFHPCVFHSRLRPAARPLMDKLARRARPSTRAGRTWLPDGSQRCLAAASTRHTTTRPDGSVVHTIRQHRQAITPWLLAKRSRRSAVSHRARRWGLRPDLLQLDNTRQSKFSIEAVSPTLINETPDPQTHTSRTCTANPIQRGHLHPATKAPRTVIATHHRSATV